MMDTYGIRPETYARHGITPKAPGAPDEWDVKMWIWENAANYPQSGLDLPDDDAIIAACAREFNWYEPDEDTGALVPHRDIALYEQIVVWEGWEP